MHLINCAAPVAGDGWDAAAPPAPAPVGPVPTPEGGATGWD